MNFIKKNMLLAIGIPLGAFAGFLYWKFVGCNSGTCAITSNPYNSTLYGAVMGGILFSIFQQKNLLNKIRHKKMLEFLQQPWPWYVAGPLIGLTVPVLLILGNKTFGISSSFRHICASCMPVKIPFFPTTGKRNLEPYLCFRHFTGWYYCHAIFSQSPSHNHKSKISYRTFRIWHNKFQQPCSFGNYELAIFILSKRLGNAGCRWFFGRLWYTLCRWLHKRPCHNGYIKPAITIINSHGLFYGGWFYNGQFYFTIYPFTLNG